MGKQQRKLNRRQARFMANDTPLKIPESQRDGWLYLGGGMVHTSELRGHSAEVVTFDEVTDFSRTKFMQTTRVRKVG